MTNELFDEIVGDLDPPMVILTANADGAPSGCLVGFATQASIDPARFLVLVSKRNHTYPVACAAGALAVHVLRHDDTDLARLFGETTGDDVDKFASVAWHEGPHGSVILDRCDWFAGPVLTRLDCGDHEAFLLAPDSGEHQRRGVAELGLSAVRDLEPGHEA